MSNATTTKATRAVTIFEIKNVEENHWKAIVHHRGAVYVCDYAPGAGDGFDPETGAPMESEVRYAWRTDRKAFRCTM